ncbi:hypothetical protein AVO45_00445 [Ruegeria marisrubri]|uniref:DUF4381 domain-containing protein n=1 Tax=Ruegeria marisrubri TaxID=1685379 RepID=A0A0X3UCN4_9RHOB|nr:DUF4381 domain-containing protein [Ruegeria marisrubri]KUJ85502.1 hypothetical protein AVO45_00445 [Ruegeria marisrubri]
MTEEDFAGKNLTELLDMLIPPSEPEAISMWPQTQGWTWLAIIAAALAIWAGLRWRARRRANAYRRAALRELRLAGEDPVVIAAILRRAALSAYPRSDIASLLGDDWLAFLDQSYGGNGFAEGPGRVIAQAPFVAAAPPVPGLETLAEQWVRRHKPIKGRS